MGGNNPARLVVGQPQRANRATASCNWLSRALLGWGKAEGKGKAKSHLCHLGFAVLDRTLGRKHHLPAAEEAVVGEERWAIG